MLRRLAEIATGGVIVVGLLWLPSAQAQSWRELPPTESAKRAPPAYLAGLPAASRYSLAVRPSRKSSARPELRIDLRDGRQLHLIGDTALHKSAGNQSWGGRVVAADGRYWGVVTRGAEASFASLSTPQGQFELIALGEHAWLVDLRHPSLRVESAENDYVAPQRGKSVRHGRAASSDSAPPAGQIRKSASATGVIDILFAYTQGFAARYPGSIAQTRIEHLMAVANQGLANSRIDLALRLVGSEQVGYTDQNDNSVALGDLRFAMNPGAGIIGLEGLAERRNALGADLVTLIRPHDIEVRGSCGIAYLFTNSSERGVNIVSDGFSSWSACSTATFLHEVGHNLGAEHQNGANSNQAGFGTAHIALQRFHTVMGSFGTGDPNRYLRLLSFSNPQIRCGGEACGLVGVADNARRIADNMAQVAAYRPEISSAPMPVFNPIDPDTDGDGLADSEDAFPFDARWQSDRDRDGVADSVDAFPDNPNESSDLDGDGIGDNADPDRDGDGVANGSDALPDDPRDSVDSDGDGVGDSQDAFVNDRREHADTDGDGIGDIADLDADGDGVADLDSVAMDLLVVSAGNDRVLRLQGDSGLFANVEMIGEFEPLAFGERGRLLWDGPRKSLLALSETGVTRYLRAPVSQPRRLLFGSARAGAPTLTGAFPSALVRDQQDRLFVSVTTNRDISRYDAITGRALPAGGFAQSNLFAQATRDLARSADGRLWMLLRDGSVVEVSPESAALGLNLPGEFLFVGAGVSDFSAMIIGPDDALWLADQAGSRIWRLLPGAVTQASIAVPAGQGGLRQPGGLAFGPDGKLYVSSTGSNQILRFEPSTGELIDVFSRVPPGSLLEPRALAFAPRIKDRYPLDASRQVRPVLGGWWNPARSGHGLELARVGDVLALTWYTYTADGKPTWYQAAAPFAGRAWQAELRRFQWNGSSASSQAVGSVTLEFSGDAVAEFSWTLPDSSGSESMQPLIVGTSSETQAPTAAWYPPAESGWGISFGRQGEVGYGLVFFYDTVGAPTWGLAAGGYDPQSMQFDLLKTFGPTRCPGCSGSENPSNQTVGSLRFALGGSESTASVDISASASGVDWQRTGAAFVPLTDTPTDSAGRPRAFDGR